MMRLVRSLVGWMGTLFFVGCSATVTAQFIGFVALSSNGMLTRDKLVRYAGVFYGVDPLEMSGDTQSPEGDSSPHRSPEELLADRVKNTPYLKDRQAVIRKGTDDIRSVVLSLRTKRERHGVLRKSFEAKLDDLEAENTVTALREIRLTLESLPPKQAKDIISAMLEEAPIGPDDDAMQDVVTVIKAMSAEKLKKIFGEFKTDNERDMLHRILVEIGNLDGRDAQLTGTQP